MGHLQLEQKHQARVRRETEDVGVLFGAGREMPRARQQQCFGSWGQKVGCAGPRGGREWDTEGAGLPLTSTGTQDQRDEC